MSEQASAFDSRTVCCIFEGLCMREDRQHLLINVLDLALSYLAVIFVVVLIYPLLNKWLLEL